ncbi:MAG TPA: DUF58 domain-containing protein [Thermoanaerobaculia bacterium]|nr:DUF58 domain-containing protein [Thermoanaerobaculia bacterium]
MFGVGAVPRGRPSGGAPGWSIRSVPESIRITKVGTWFVVLTVLVALAATNTGNNAVYMVWSALLAILVVSGVVSRQNLRRLALRLSAPTGEVFAHQPCAIPFEIENRGRFWSRWFLLLSLSPQGRPWLLPQLTTKARGQGEFEVAFPRRGRQAISAVHVTSLFPFGLFRKGARYGAGLEVLVFPELFAAASEEPEAAGEVGSRARRRAGWGHDLHALRAFRPGDDPRGIHWKQTARTGRTIYLEREAEDARRLSVLLDNHFPAGSAEAARERFRERFERLVSEAATATVDYLARGWEVELVTQEGRIGFGSGPRHRWALLEALALVEAREGAPEPLVPGDPRAQTLALGGEAS